MTMKLHHDQGATDSGEAMCGKIFRTFGKRVAFVYTKGGKRMLVYTISKSDLYQSGIEPTHKVLESSSADQNVNYAHIFAKILLELTSKSGT